MITAKEIEQTNNGYYELFVEEIVKDINGNDVTIPRSIGQYSLPQLEQEKQNYLNVITSIEEKITAISELAE